MKLYSERLFLKYLVSNHGICLGVELDQRSYLLHLTSRGLIWQRRPAGDRVVENSDYEIPAIVRAVEHERAQA